MSKQDKLFEILAANYADFAEAGGIPLTHAYRWSMGSIYNRKQDVKQALKNLSNQRRIEVSNLRIKVNGESTPYSEGVGSPEIETIEMYEKDTTHPIVVVGGCQSGIVTIPLTSLHTHTIGLELALLKPFNCNIYGSILCFFAYSETMGLLLHDGLISRTLNLTPSQTQFRLRRLKNAGVIQRVDEADARALETKRFWAGKRQVQTQAVFYSLSPDFATLLHDIKEEILNTLPPVQKAAIQKFRELPEKKKRALENDLEQIRADLATKNKEGIDNATGKHIDYLIALRNHAQRRGITEGELTELLQRGNTNAD